MAETNPTQNVTRFFGLGLTPGKLRGLHRISNPNGTLTMVALDQNSSMIKMIKDAGEEDSFQNIANAKVHLARTLSPCASAILVDAYYGAFSTVASCALPRDVGLLIRVEKSGSDKNDRGAPLGEIEAGWGVHKIKSFGADAVKLLAQYEPTEENSAEHQFALSQYCYEECKKHDILFLLETVHFPFDGEKKGDKSVLNRKAETVIESARQLSRFCDVYKAEFPGTMGHESDAQLQDNLKALNDVCERPWVLLSAGVDFPDYKKQVEMAMSAGASGVLGGRAFWKEYFLRKGHDAREEFARGECQNRIRQVDDIVQRDATPWFARSGLTQEQLHSMRAAEGWHFRYQAVGAKTGASANVEGEVY